MSRRRTQPAPNFGGKGKGKSKAAGVGKAPAPRPAAAFAAHDGLPGWLWALAFGLVLGAAGMAWLDRSGWLKADKPSHAAPAVLMATPRNNPAPPDELEIVPPLTAVPQQTPPPHAALPRPLPPYKATPSPLASARMAPSISAKTRVAIVMDDAGLRSEPVHLLGTLPVKLTLAVIPHLPESRAVAEYWHGLGREVILHLPMEANDNLAHEAGEGALLTGMSDQAVRDTVAGDINAVPYITGINNHMGSRATSDGRLMGVLMDALKPSGLYFLDSRTAASSVAYETARTHGIRSAWRNGTFLDNERSENAISAALHTLLAQARAQGGAVGIGHVTSPETIAVLSRELPALQGQYEFVYASELTR